MPSVLFWCVTTVRIASAIPQTNRTKQTRSVTLPADPGMDPAIQMQAIVLAAEKDMPQAGRDSLPLLEQKDKGLPAP